tara:strand:- start:81 stop:593 length:513 start_codon:yes stop_codon:yes gene_type:complete
MGQQNNMVSGAWHSSAEDYKESLKEPQEQKVRLYKGQKVNIKEINRNYMKKWSKEEDKKLMDILDEYVEQDKIINYDEEFRMQFGRTAGSLTSRIRKLIFEKYDESSWEDCVKAAAMGNYEWEAYVKAQTTNKEISEDIKKDRELKKIEILIQKYNENYDKNLKLVNKEF